MLKRILRKMRKKLDAKRTFRIHLVAFHNYNIDDYLMLVNECAPVKIVNEDATHEKTVEVKMRPSQLRMMLARLPDDEVTAAYEEH